MLINIADDIYRPLLKVAEATAQPLEKVVADHLKFRLQDETGLPPDEQAELQALNYLSEDTLWTITAEQMPPDIQDQMQILMDKNNFGTITDLELAQLTEYVERGNRLMVRKAEAAAILTRRGYSVKRQDFKQKHG